MVKLFKYFLAFLVVFGFIIGGPTGVTTVLIMFFAWLIPGRW